MCVECSICMYILQGWVPFRCRIYMLRVCDDHHCALGGVPGRTLVWRTINPFAQHQPQPMEGKPDNRNHSHQERFLSPHTYPISRFPLSQKIAAPRNGCILRNLLVSTGYTYYARSLQAAGLQFASRKPAVRKATCICVCMHSR